MGISTKGFIHSANAKDFNWKDAIDYISSMYKIIRIKPVEDGMYIGLKDGDEYRQIQILDRYASYVVEDYPEIANTAKVSILPNAKSYIVSFSLGYGGNSVEIIRDIVSHFGGGYMIEDDCNRDWIEV